MSSNQKALGLIVIAMALLAGVVVTSRAFGPRQRQEPAKGEAKQDLHEEVRRLNSRIAEVEAASARRLAVLGRQMEQATPKPSLEAESASQKSGDSEGQPAEAEPDEAEQQAEIVAQLENEFQAEPHDPGWSRGAIAEATRALSQDLPRGSKLGAVVCRTNMCRIESFHDDVQAFQSFVKSALLSRGKQLWNSAFNSYVVEQSPTGVAALTFIGRESPPEAVAPVSN
jgi:hypothetical protein